MKITSARVVVTCPGRNFVTLVVETDEGVTGIGGSLVPVGPRHPLPDRP